MENPKKKEKEKKQPNTFLRFSGMATQMAVIIGIGVFGGKELDAYFKQDQHTFTLIGSLLGVGVALYFVIKDLSK
ncbi:MAG: AtpZ/AtpI family protein [Vicingaceae bacterium]